MKNAIQYYYGLYPENIFQSNGSYEFDINHMHYYLTPYNRSMEELEELYRISIQLLERQIYCHQFVFNMKREIITVINHIPYVLMKVFITSKQNVTINDILFFSGLTMRDTEKSLLRRNEWKKLWMEKNDYLEYQVSQFGKRYPKIRESFGYFIGLSETGICMFNEVEEETTLVISHRRICSKNTLFDLYNPLTFILDYKERDIIEFWKSEVLNESFLLEDFKKFMEMLSLNKNEMIRLFARSFYPTFYFDKYEQIIDYHENEEILNEVLDKISIYEAFLKFLYFYVRERALFPDMIWLTKSIG